MTFRCVNCSLRVDRLRRHRLSEVTQETVERLRRWVYPRDISGADYVCHACWELINHSIEHEQSPSLGHRAVCVACGRSILRHRSHLVNRADRVINIIAEWAQPYELQPTDQVCTPCWLRAQRVVRRRESQGTVEQIEQLSEPIPMSEDDRSENQVQVDEAVPLHSVEEQVGPSNQPVIEEQVGPSNQPVTEEQVGSSNQPVTEEITLPTLRRAAATARRCLFPACDDQEKIHVPDTIRRRIIIDFNFYIPINARICKFHLESNLYHEVYTAENSLSTFTADYIEDVVFLLREEKHFDFSQPENMDDNLFKYWFGRTKLEYRDVLAQVPQIDDFKKKLGFTALLCKMRTGDSDERISALFQVPRRTLETYMTQARKILMEHYVPRHLGLNHISREEVIARNSRLAENLFGNPEEDIENRHIIAIADGTYLNTQKSTNYSFQKDTYSLHKFHNLVKPFVICCCDGYILKTCGPYPATKNDASIMKDLLENNELSPLFREDDIFILDRGFRDCRDELMQQGFQVHMPETISEGERQLTTLQANITRCVTMNRWVVEAVNGRFSRDYKIFRADYLNTSCPHIMEEFSIAAAFLNNFAVQFSERRNIDTILDIIQEKIFQDNILGQIVQQNNLNMRHSYFHNISTTNVVFPELSLEDLKLIALGTYQIRQAQSYVGEHLKAHGMYEIEVCREEAASNILEEFNGEDPYILRARIKSRHVTSRSYFTYIVIDRQRQGREAILGYYCYCPAGKHTVGCCSHTMSIMWYMGFARHQGNIRVPAAFLDDVLRS